MLISHKGLFSIINKENIMDIEKNIYYGLSFTDIFQKTITIGENGIIISRNKGIWHKFQRTIPYSAVLDIHNHPANLFTAGYFSILTSVGGVVHQASLLIPNQTNEIAEDENSFAYRKKHNNLIQKIITTINTEKENSSIFRSDPLTEYWGMCFKDMFGKKLELTPTGVFFSKGTWQKTISYSDILDVYIKFPEKAMEGGILSIVKNTGLTAYHKLEKIINSNPARFTNDETSIHFAKNSNKEVEKIYYAIIAIREFSTYALTANTYENFSNYSNVTTTNEMSGHEFEYFCAELLRNNGFFDVNVTKGSGDQGVDILATKDGIKYAIQCKNYTSALGNTPVQEVSAGKIFYNCHVGIVLTNSTFTSGAISLAKATGVLLWDKNVLSELMKAQPTSKIESTNSIESTYVDNPIPKDNSMHHSTLKPTHTIYSNTLSHPHTETLLQKKNIQIDNICIEIDTQSFSRYNILLDNFGTNIDEDDEDSIELLFDVISKTEHKLPCTIDIVCNLYIGSRKAITERESIYDDSFEGKDSLSILFFKKKICKTATKIELFCQKW